MHKYTKLTPVFRREIFKRWSQEEISMRQLAREYHVDKKIIQRIVIRGKQKDFSVHTSANVRYMRRSRGSRAGRSSATI